MRAPTNSRPIWLFFAYTERLPLWATILATLLVPTPLALCWLRESPHFLLSSGQPARARAVLSEVARVNGSQLAGMSLKGEGRGAAPDGGGTAASRGGMARLRRDWAVLLPLTSSAALAYFGSTASYYGVVLWPLQIGNGLYATTALGALLEVPVYASAPALSRRLGPTRLWVVFLAWSAASWAGLCVTGVDGTWRSTALLLSARFSGTGSTTICFVAISEAFPSTFRGTGLGIASIGGRLGSVAAPLLVHLAPTVTASTAILAALAAGSAACAYALLRLRASSGSHAALPEA